MRSGRCVDVLDNEPMSVAVKSFANAFVQQEWERERERKKGGGGRVCKGDGIASKEHDLPVAIA